jgi:hypothetical protein
VPRGVYVAPKNSGKAEVEGLYLDQPGDTFCCWLAPDARVSFEKPKNAKAVALTIEVIDIQKFRANPAVIDISAQGKMLVHEARVRPGILKIHVPLPNSMQTSVGPYTLDIHSSGFVPAVEHVTGDTRHLGVILRGIAPD